MFGIDKLKLLIKIEDVEIINENAFTKKIKGDELVELTYKQETPFYLMVKINYQREEAIVEFTGKVLLSEYHNLIRLGNIRKCFDNINALGICKINNYIIADTLKCDIANDVNVPDVKTLSKFIYSNINSYQKFTPEYIKNGNFIVQGYYLPYIPESINRFYCGCNQSKSLHICSGKAMKKNSIKQTS